ncbi:MinD/ParA family ATP-binding protein [Parafrankia sp. FMc2]|uniref:MinD/ParA family ATP-binding protein n=1 Tax=Parafrankia sp. FMc2 TaxID=3233196 RepID=UPI0034D59D8D
MGDLVIIAVGSLKASPGATTLALALADRWPTDGGDPLVVEADPAGGDLGARFGLLAGGRGLVTLAAAGRRGGGQRSAEDHAHQLPGGLAVIPAPTGAEQASQVLGELDGGGWSLLWSAAQTGGRTVIVDCGRLDPWSPAGPALRAADVLLLVVRARDEELAHLAARLHVVQGWALPAWYVVVVAQPHRAPDYRVREIARVLGSQVLGPVPHDTTAAEVLAGRRQTRTGIGRSKLGRTVAGIAGYLAATVPAGSERPALGAAPAGSNGRAALPPTPTRTVPR